MDAQLKKEIEKRMNTAQTNAEMVSIVTGLRQRKIPDMDILAVGFLITKMMRKVVEGHGDDQG